MGNINQKLIISNFDNRPINFSKIIGKRNRDGFNLITSPPNKKLKKKPKNKRRGRSSEPTDALGITEKYILKKRKFNLKKQNPNYIFTVEDVREIVQRALK